MTLGQECITLGITKSLISATDDNEPVHPDEKNEPDVIVSVDDCLF